MAKLTALLLSSALILGLSPSYGIAQIAKNRVAVDKRKAEIAAIKSYENEVPFLLSLTVCQFVKDSPTASWREVKPEFGDSTWHFLTATVGIHKGKPASVSIDHGQKNQKTPDGSVLLFRPDGTLAKYILIVDVWSKNSLRTSKGKIQYFDAKGGVLLTVIESKNWKTKKFTHLKSLSVSQLPVYMRVEQLPLYALLKDKKKGATKPAPTSSTPPIKPEIEAPSK